MLTPYKLKGRLQHRDAVRLPLMTDFIVVRQPSSPYVWNRYQVLLLPANPPAKMSGFDIGFMVSAHQQDVARFPTNSIRDNLPFSNCLHDFGLNFL